MLAPQRLLLLSTIARCGSLTAAAVELGYSPSALSQQLAALERAVRAPVLERHARGVRPNHVGALLVKHADRIAAVLREAETDVADVLRGAAGTVDIASFPSASSSFVPRAIAEFLTEQPQVELVLRDLEPSESLPLVRDRVIDAAVVFHYPALAELLPVGTEVTTLFDDPLLLVLPRAHDLSRQRRISVRDLSGVGWVHGHDWGAGTRLLQVLCRQAGFDPVIACETDSYDVQQTLVEAGLGAALIPELAIDRRREGLAVRRIEDATPFRRVSLATGAGHGRAALAAFLHTLTATPPG